MLSSNYNDVLILFSFIVAMLASYTALDMAGRVATTQGKSVEIVVSGRRTCDGNWHLVDAFYRHAGLQFAGIYGL
ncbi:NO-binding membrane sensor protein with MHYT domain [Ewingella americana]